jgi:ribose transport system ATP-binding protein
VEIKVRPGEVHALMGENGAGKSTLMKILGGAYTLDEGLIYINGQEVKIHNPVESALAGVAVIYQEQALVNSLTVEDNIMLGRFPNYCGLINKNEMHEKARRALDFIESDFDLEREVGTLTVAQKQFVEIAKALSMDANIIVMDEPSSVLTLSETRKMFDVVKQLKEQGRSIIYISHRMEEIFEICDRCTVLKDGSYVGTENTKEITNFDLIKMMTGRDIKDIFPEKEEKFGEEIFKVDGLMKKGVFDNISFSIRAGEIVGMAGLVGSGRTEVTRAIMGIDKLDAGSIYLDNVKIDTRDPRKSMNQGLMYVSEDRKENGMIVDLSIRENMTLSTVDRYSRFSFISKRKELEAIDKMMKLLKVKSDGINQTVRDLSGGNQQKVMLANGILVDAKIIIIDEPTRGVDIGTKTEIYKIIKEIAKSGKAVLVISSELPEVIGLSNRILVMYRGRISGEIMPEDFTEENILTYATGVN